MQNGERGCTLTHVKLIDVEPGVKIPKWALERALVSTSWKFTFCHCLTVVGGADLPYVIRGAIFFPSNSGCWFSPKEHPGSQVWWGQSLILPAVLKSALMTSSSGLNPGSDGLAWWLSLCKEHCRVSRTRQFCSLSFCCEANPFWSRQMWIMYTLPCIGIHVILCQSSVFSRAKFVHIQDTINSSGAMCSHKYCVGHG